ncbi:MAG: sugar nucleotide-binding protein [Gemmatimonas sp.]|jgi:dTDP-4-dehydrorhamnose reductase|uniref:sugar nucleotide-binding protein n=1 Tax=Gemmatimonas sp. TaxID=1962908 RepID=UPI00391F7FBA|nr:sugar nucleotide-binding protein [Gemmatimonadota bacterium]
MSTAPPTPRVLVLGGTGMLGAMVTDVLARSPDIALTVTSRTGTRPGISGPAARVSCLAFDAERDELPALSDFTWVINCIGVIKPYIKDDHAAQVERAIRVNALFPHRLAEAASAAGARVLQIATDCVWSGRTGRYVEGTAHDALDAYGRTKSLGEVPAEPLHHLRCSIIGPEVTGHVSLLDWFRGQPHGARLTGFTNHLWNGITTYHFARLCDGIVRTALPLPRVQHVIPTGLVTKAAMLDAFAATYGRADLTIAHGEAPTVVDRTLATADADTNAALWRAAGYAEPPTFHAMLTEMAAHPFNS